MTVRIWQKYEVFNLNDKTIYQKADFYFPVSSSKLYNKHNAVAIRTGTVRRVWFAIRTAVGIFLAIVGEIFVFFDFYNLTFVKQQ